MNFFLKIPHWGLFLLIMGFVVLGFPFTIFGVFLGSTVFISLIYLVFLLVPSTLYASWLFSAGKLLYHSGDKQETNFKLFKFNFFFGLCYMILAYLFVYVFFDSELLSSVIFLPIHLYALFCLFYEIYFVSRNLAIAERKGSNLGDYVGYFFLVWLFPVGIWVIQPKINTLYRK